MATTTTRTRPRTARRTGARPQMAAPRARTAAERAGAELPARLGQLTARMRRQLALLERQVDRAQARYRRQAARLLREASEELGRLETLGQRRWRTLDARARRRLLDLLQRLEAAVGPEAGERTERARRVARSAVRGAQRTLRRAADALEP